MFLILKKILMSIGLFSSSILKLKNFKIFKNCFLNCSRLFFMLSVLLTRFERYISFFFQVINDQNISKNICLGLGLLKNEFWSLYQQHLRMFLSIFLTLPKAMCSSNAIENIGVVYFDNCTPFSVFSAAFCKIMMQK